MMFIVISFVSLIMQNIVLLDETNSEYFYYHLGQHFATAFIISCVGPDYSSDGKRSLTRVFLSRPQDGTQLPASLEPGSYLKARMVFEPCPYVPSSRVLGMHIHKALQTLSTRTHKASSILERSALLGPGYLT